MGHDRNRNVSVKDSFHSHTCWSLFRGLVNSRGEGNGAPFNLLRLFCKKNREIFNIFFKSDGQKLCQPLSKKNP